LAYTQYPTPTTNASVDASISGAPSCRLRHQLNSALSVHEADDAPPEPTVDPVEPPVVVDAVPDGEALEPLDVELLVRDRFDVDVLAFARRFDDRDDELDEPDVPERDDELDEPDVPERDDELLDRLDRDEELPERDEREDELPDRDDEPLDCDDELLDRDVELPEPLDRPDREEELPVDVPPFAAADDALDPDGRVLESSVRHALGSGMPEVRLAT